MEELDRVTVDPLDVVNVAAAAARLGGSGGWDRLLAGTAPEDRVDVVDVELLTAVGLVSWHDGTPRVTRDDLALLDGHRLQQGYVALLRRALHHAEGGDSGWHAEDAQLLLAQGRGSAMAVGLIVDHLGPLMPGATEPFEAGEGRFLDTGVGVAAISIALCQRFPGARAVGLDVLPEVLELAASEVADAGLQERIELRQQSVADLADHEAYDLAWLPQPFIPPAAYDEGLGRLRDALRPGGWIVSPLMTTPEGADPVDAALMAHTGHVIGGGPVRTSEVSTRMAELGYVDVATFTAGGQVILYGRRP